MLNEETIKSLIEIHRDEPKVLAAMERCLTSFEDYQVYEVRLTNPQTGDEGKLVYDDIERIEEGSTLTVGGQPKDKVHQEGFSYEVSYTVGEPFGGRDNVNNVRVDTVTNTRQGIKLVKTDWNGNNLPGAVFTLKDADGDAVRVPGLQALQRLHVLRQLVHVHLIVEQIARDGHVLGKTQFLCAQGDGGADIGLIRLVRRVPAAHGVYVIDPVF